MGWLLSRGAIFICTDTVSLCPKISVDSLGFRTIPVSFLMSDERSVAQFWHMETEFALSLQSTHANG